MKRYIPWIVVFVLVFIVGLWAIGGYNRLVALDQKVQGAWSKVETDYQRRNDLIPNLVNTVKGAANFEQETLTGVVEARAQATSVQIDPAQLDQQSLERFQDAQGEVSSALGRLLAVAEAYPQLRATEGFRDLQVQLEGTENRIAVSRKDFNGTVQEYNTVTRSFPTVIFARIFGFGEKGYFKSVEGAAVAPEVNFES